MKQAFIIIEQVSQPSFTFPVLVHLWAKTNNKH